MGHRPNDTPQQVTGAEVVAGTMNHRYSFFALRCSLKIYVVSVVNITSAGDRGRKRACVS